MSGGVFSEEYQRTAHLLRRAGFGADHDTIQSYVQMGLQKAVDSLINYNPEGNPLEIVEDRLENDQLGRFDINGLQTWWLNRMVHTTNPLQEKMTLFWHGHFVSAYNKVTDTALLYRQNQLFRRMALGNFRDLTLAVSKDPAMIWYLDNQTNRKGHANENYGRELMELFTLGIGHYTEEDVRQGARAFTGWSFNRLTGEYQFLPRQHDDGIKTYLGQTGNFNGNDVVDILMKQPSCAPFICSKLYKFFIHDNPTADDIKPFADTMISSNMDIKPVVRQMLLSDVFYSPKAMWQKFKSPTEFVVDAIRITGSQFPLRYTPQYMTQMGQELFDAPSVKGWDGGKTWINTNTLFSRFNYAMTLARLDELNDPLLVKIEGVLKSGTVQNASDVVDYYTEHLLHRTLSDQSKQVLVGYLNAGKNGNPEPFEIPSGNRIPYPTLIKVHGMLHVMMLTPEFQVC